MPDFTPRPTVYKGIQMRSRLEAGFAQWLDERRVPDWQYEPKAFGSPDGQYLPDFYVPEMLVVARDPLVAPAYIEVKPTLTYETAPRIARQMAVIWESEPGVHLLVVRPERPDPPSVGVVAEDGGGPDDGPGVVGPFQFLIRNTGEPLAIGAPWPAELAPWSDGYWEVK